MHTYIQDEEMRGRELSFEGFLFCITTKEIRYEKLVSIDGKYKHIQKQLSECCHSLLFNLFHSYFFKALFLLNKCTKHTKYKPAFIYRFSSHQTVYSFLNDNNVINKNKISDILRGGMVFKKRKEVRWKKLSLKAALQSI